MSKLLRIGDRLINPENITYIIDREIHFNDGSRWVATEPEIQDLLAIMFETPRPMTMEMPEQVTKSIKKVIKKK